MIINARFERCKVDKMRTLVEKFHFIGDDCRAVTMLEYAIMGSIIAAALVLAVPQLTSAVSTNLQFMADKVPATGH